MSTVQFLRSIWEIQERILIFRIKMQSNFERKNVVKYLNLLLFTFIIVFLIGLLTFRYLFNQDWVDSFYYTVTFGISAESISETKSQKLFLAFYFLIAGFLFVAVASHLIEHIMDVVD